MAAADSLADFYLGLLRVLDLWVGYPGLVLLLDFLPWLGHLCLVQLYHVLLYLGLLLLGPLLSELVPYLVSPYLHCYCYYYLDVFY